MDLAGTRREAAAQRPVGPTAGVGDCRRTTRGGTFVERYGRRDGVGVGGVARAALVNGDTAAATTEQRRQRHRIDTLDRAWVRNRDDVDALSELHAAIADHLAESAGSR